MNKSSLIKQVEDFIAPYTRIVVAFSGGLDSTVLLHLLWQIRLRRADLQLRAQHIHHGLSPNADAWAQHCQQVCQQWQIPLQLSKVNLTQHRNIEAQARQLRYQALQQNLQPAEVIALGHHLDDQAETFLLALKRGSGPTGLAAMAPQSIHGEAILVRPLLDISREQLLQYAIQHQLRWIEDESNQSLRYDRNFLRQTILPALAARWPQFNRMLARSAALCAQQKQLLDELLLPQLQSLLDQDGGLAIAPMLALSSARRDALLRLWLKQQHCLMPEQQQLTQLWQDVALAKADANPQFILTNKQLRRYQDKLYLQPNWPALPTALSWAWPEPITLPQDLGQLQINTDPACANLRAPLAGEKVTIRFHAEGKVRMVGRAGSRSLKKLWQELQVPPWMRQRIPLIFYNDQLISAVGYFVTEPGAGQDYAIQHIAV